MESPTLDVSVGEQDVEGLEFKQTGYLLQCHSSHPTLLVSNIPTKDPGSNHEKVWVKASMCYWVISMWRL